MQSVVDSYLLVSVLATVGFTLSAFFRRVLDVRLRCTERRGFDTVRWSRALVAAFSDELCSAVEGAVEGAIYTQQKKKVNTYSTLIISYTNSIDGKCSIPYEREIPLL